MMLLHNFRLENDDSLIIVEATINDEILSLALDTGASHTVIDLSTLMMLGFEVSDALSAVRLETGKGEVDALIFKIPALEALDVTREGIEICSYDFLNHDVLLNIHGVLGLDFFKGMDLHISFKRFEIVVEQ